MKRHTSHVSWKTTYCLKNQQKNNRAGYPSSLPAEYDPYQNPNVGLGKNPNVHM